MKAFKNKSEDFKQNTSPHRQPVETTEDRSYVFKFPFACHKPCCWIMHSTLYSLLSRPAIKIWQAWMYSTQLFKNKFLRMNSEISWNLPQFPRNEEGHSGRVKYMPAKVHKLHHIDALFKIIVLFISIQIMLLPLKNNLEVKFTKLIIQKYCMKINVIILTVVITYKSKSCSRTVMDK